MTYLIPTTAQNSTIRAPLTAHGSRVTAIEHLGKLSIAEGNWLQGKSDHVVLCGIPLVVCFTGRLVLP